MKRRHSTTVVGEASADRGVDALFRAEYEPMHRLAFTMLGSDADAEEVVQDAFVGLAARWETVSNPGGYLRTSVVNGARTRWRALALRGEVSGDVRDPCIEGGHEHYLLDVIDTLPERQRTAVMLTYYADLSSVEIGALLDCEPATVRSLVHRALARLAEVVER